MKTSAIILCFTLCAAHADTLLDFRLPGRAGGGISPGAPYSFASAFSVGASDVEITSISFLLGGRSDTPYEFTAYIFSNSVDHPGTLLGSSHRSFVAGDFTGQGGAFYQFAFSAPLPLSAGVRYWASIGTYPAGYPPVIYDTSYLEDFTSHGIEPSLSLATSSSYHPTEWGVNAPTDTLVYKLEGSVIPEPGSAGLLVMGFGLAARRCRRQAKR